MKRAETVTFGGSGLDRAADLRNAPERLAELWPAARVLLMWRGRPLMAEAGGLVWLPSFDMDGTTLTRYHQKWRFLMVPS